MFDEITKDYGWEIPNPFPRCNYDLILSAELIGRLYNRDLYLKNLNSWLKEGSYLIITTPCHGYLKNLIIALTNKFDNHINSLWEGGHIKFFSKKTLSHLLRDNGFKPIYFKGSGRMLYLWKSMIIIAKKL
ncbi:MAG: class I SAM-dependent methyltransferase [Deltaproteobacteria bacterium]|nr:class I SAM-dependent methyltransferase [Deltaproteobacteria bacterium]